MVSSHDLFGILGFLALCGFAAFGAWLSYRLRQAMLDQAREAIEAQGCEVLWIRRAASFVPGSVVFAMRNAKGQQMEASAVVVGKRLLNVKVRSGPTLVKAPD